MGRLGLAIALIMSVTMTATSPSAAAAAPDAELVSIRPDGEPFSTPSRLSDLSPDGRFVLFRNGNDAWLRDRTKRTSELIASDLDADECGSLPSLEMSSDARFVLFMKEGIRVLDRTTGASQLIADISVSDYEQPPRCAVISADGSTIAFVTSSASGMVVADRVSGAERALDPALFADPGNASSIGRFWNGFALSPDGRYLALPIDEYDLPCAEEDPDDCSLDSARVIDLATNDVEDLSGYWAHRVTAGGDILTSDAQYGEEWINVSNHLTKTRELIAFAFDTMRAEDLSEDGRYVLLTTRTDLDPADAGDGLDLYLRDREGKTFQLLESDVGYGHAAISADGGLIAFQSDVDGLAPEDGNGVSDVFVRSYRPPDYRLRATWTRSNSRVTARWRAIPGAIEYQVAWRTADPDAGERPDEQDLTWETAATTTGRMILSSIPDDHWVELQIRVRTAAGWRPWSAEATVFAKTSAVATPELITYATTSPAPGELVVAWYPAIGATAYDLQWRDVDADSWTLRRTTSTERRLVGLQQGKDYQVRVRGRAGTAVSPWSAVLVETVAAADQPPPRAPLTVTGMTVEAGQRSIIVTWDPTPTATDHLVQFRPAGTTVWRQRIAADTSRSVTGLGGDRDYEIRVRARRDNTAGPWSAIMTVRTDP